MRFAYILLTLSFSFALAAEPTNEEKCNTELERSAEVKQLIKKYREKCGKFPAKLNHLIDGRKFCKAWKEPFMKDTPENRRWLEEGYVYALAKGGYSLTARDCPN